MSAYTAKELLDIQEKINSSPEEQSTFVNDPRAYLERSNIKLPDELIKELSDNLAEMRIGPRSFAELAAMNNRALGIMISIRIPF